MREDVQISYRGATYELGQGPQFYGIWAAGRADAQPLEWWPKTPAGWSGAWARFVTMEAPGSIAPVDEAATNPGAGHAADAAGAPTQTIGAPTQSFGASAQAEGAPTQTLGGTGQAALSTSAIRGWIAGGLLAFGVGLGIVGLFPSYLSGASLASAADELVPHLIYLAAWAASAALIALGAERLRIGALLGVGTSIVTFGLFFSDAGEVMGHQATAGPGLALGLISWVACAAGSGLALRVSRADGPGKPDRRELVAVVTLIVAGIGAAAAFAPSWDSYLLRWDAGIKTVTLGNAFANPAPVIVGDVLVMVAVVAAIAVAALWRPVRHGGVLVIGAAVPLLAQAVSALLQFRLPTSPLTFGVTQAEASAIGLTISNGLTPMFWVFCGFVVTLGLLAVRMLIADDLMVPASYGPRPAAPAGWMPASPQPDAVAQVAAPAAASTGTWPFFAPQQDATATGQGPDATQPGGGTPPAATQPPATT